jgi:hypothetical protein
MITAAFGKINAIYSDCRQETGLGDRTVKWAVNIGARRVLLSIADVPFLCVIRPYVAAY